MNRKTTEIETTAVTQAAKTDAPPAEPGRAADRALAADIRRYGEDLERRYVAAREGWTRAMRAAASGKPADMASLAIAQEAYEAVTEEREHWLAGGKVAIPAERDASHDIEVAVGQELEWRRVLAPPPRPGFLARIRRRLGGG
jgi:hypothetical protein